MESATALRVRYLFIFLTSSRDTFEGRGKLFTRAVMPTLHVVKPWSQGWLIAAGAYPGFCSMKRLEVFLLPLDGLLVHRRSLPRNFVRFPQQIAGTYLYTGGERHCESKVSCPRTQHNVPSQAPESSALTMRPPRLPSLHVAYIYCRTT